jgi:nitrite reductase/ring-hydroxylating ferredoxin subunit
MLVSVGQAEDFGPGQMHAVDVGGTTVGIANADGRVYAIDDTCTHMGCSLATGQLDGTTVTCRCHGSQFDVTSGRVLRGPAQEPVRSHLVEIQAGELLVEK